MISGKVSPKKGESSCHEDFLFQRHGDKQKILSRFVQNPIPLRCKGASVQPVKVDHGGVEVKHFRICKALIPRWVKQKW